MLPIRRPDDANAAALLGPAAERLTQTFSSRDEYAEFWHEPPAFVDDWSPEVRAYVEYDLDQTPGGFTPSTRLGAVAQDALQLDGADCYVQALAALDKPIEFLRAPRGLMNEPAALYSPEAVAEWGNLSSIQVREVANVNHYTIIMSEVGARDAAATVRTHLLPAEHDDKAGKAGTAYETDPVEGTL